MVKMVVPPSRPSKILALDLGKRCGFAFGAPREIPRSGAWVLGGEGDPHGVIFNNLVHALELCFRDDRPDLIIKEQNRSLQIAGRVKRNEASIAVTYGLHSMVQMMATRFGIRLLDAHIDTVRVHFLGHARGGREVINPEIVNRAHLLGYFPKTKYDEDRGNACAIWDFGVSLYCGQTAMYHLT
jgi:hypothetical protein